MEQQTYSQPETTNSPDISPITPKKNKRPIAVILCIVILLTAAAVAYFLLRPEDKPSNNAPSSDTRQSISPEQQAPEQKSEAQIFAEERLIKEADKVLYQIPELNIKFEVNDQTDDLVYERGNVASYMKLSSVSLIAKENEEYPDTPPRCSADSLPLGIIRVRDREEAFTDETLIKKVSDFTYVFYSQPHTNCDSEERQKLQKLIQDQTQAIKQTLSTAQLIKSDKEVVNENGFYEIKELGIKFKPGAVKDFYHTFGKSGSLNSYVKFSSRSLFAKEKELYGSSDLHCGADNLPLGIVRVRPINEKFYGDVFIKKSR